MAHASNPSSQEARPQLLNDVLDSRIFMTRPGLHHAPLELAIYKTTGVEFVCFRDNLLVAFFGQSPTASFLGRGRIGKATPILLPLFTHGPFASQ